MKPRKFILFSIAAMLAVSCTCQQRIERLQRHCPECFETTTVENIVTLPGTDIEAILPIDWQPGRQASLTLPIKIDTRQGILNIDIHDTVAAVSLTVPPDTIRLRDTITLPPRTIVKEKPAFSVTDKMLLAAILVMVIMLPILMRK